jgi:chromosome segregation ATPase
VLGQCVTSEVSKICANEVIGSKEKFLVKQAKQIKSQDGQLFNFYNSYQAKKHLLNEREEELTRMKMTSEERIHELEVDAELKNARILKLEGDLKNGDEVKESQAATIKKLQLDVILKEQHMVELEEEIASLKEKVYTNYIQMNSQLLFHRC